MNENENSIGLVYFSLKTKNEEIDGCFCNMLGRKYRIERKASNPDGNWLEINYLLLHEASINGNDIWKEANRILRDVKNNNSNKYPDDDSILIPDTGCI